VTGRRLVRAAGGVRLEPQPPADPGRAHVRMLAAGVCGTDVQIAARTRPDVASVLGHEGVGVLDGRLVVFNPVGTRDPLSILGHSYDGVFRSWVPVSEVPEDALCTVEPVEPVWLLALCEPLATVLYSWELIAARALLDVGIWGAGPIGVLQAAVAAERGHRVTVVQPSASRRAWLRTQPLGAGVAAVASAQAVPRGLDVAVLCVPKPVMASAVREAADALAPEGLMVLVPGLEPEAAAPTFADPGVGAVRRRHELGRLGEPIVARTLAGKWLRVTGHRGTSLEQLRAASERLRRDPSRYAALVTHRVGPDAAVALINARCAGRARDERGGEIVKVVIDFAAPDG